MLHMRPGTFDQLIYEMVVAANEYCLPDRFEPADVVVDVGAHIGAFAHAALMRGCGHVHGVEADLENLQVATENLRSYIDEGAVTLTYGAAWRSDVNDDDLSFHGYPSYGQTVNTGGGRVLPVRSGCPIPKVNFDAFLLGSTRGGEHRVRFLKLDCEGSEWPILFTARRLDLVDEIAGEFHELEAEGPDSGSGYSGLTCEDLGETLGAQGFEVTLNPYPIRVPFFRRIGLFFAKRKERCTYQKRAAEERPPGLWIGGRTSGPSSPSSPHAEAKETICHSHGTRIGTAQIKAIRTTMARPQLRSSRSSPRLRETAWATRGCSGR